jgi:RND superfamily putative drug exporter
MTGPLYRLGHFCVRHRLVVIAIWLVVFLALVVGARSVGLNTSDNLTLPGTNSQDATDLLNDKFPQQANGSVPIVFVAPPGHTLEESKYQDSITDVFNDYTNDKGAVNDATSPFSSDGADQLSQNQTIAYISLLLKDSPSELNKDEAQKILDIAKPAESTGMRVSAGGYVGQKLSKPSTNLSVVVGIVAAIIILLFTFGTVVAMGMPITTAILGLVSGLGIITLLGEVVDVPTTAPALATMIGLGVGIDYGLFIVTRHRFQLSRGMEVRESVARATATSGGAVVFAGTTVIIALVSLLVAGIPLVTTLGYTAAIVVLIAVLTAITLMPALLGLLGMRINALKLPGLKQEHDVKPHGWRRWAMFVANHPWPSIAVALVILFVLAFPIRNLQLGQTNNGALPKDTNTRKSYDAICKGFGCGENGPMLIAVSLSQPAQNDQQQLDASLQNLRTDMENTPGVKSVSQPLVNDNGDAAVYTVIPDYGPSSTKTADVVKDLRDNTIPKATKGQNMTAYVGGTTASYIDLASQITSKLPLVIGVVLALSFVLLLIAFRSVLVPAKAVIMNLISICAAFGIVTYVFGHHWASTFVGLPFTVPIVSYVPLMMFAILFGLSMDYEVFLMSRMREEYKKSRDEHDAVVEGLANTGRVITSAALIMVSVFCAFILNGDPNIKQFGVGMAAAVAVDATIIRCLLVPAIMTLFGRAAWWMPRWLGRVTPKFSIEGEEWFAERDAAAARVRAETEEPPPKVTA